MTVAISGVSGCVMGSMPDIEFRNETEREITEEVTVSRYLTANNSSKIRSLSPEESGDCGSEKSYSNAVGTETV